MIALIKNDKNELDILCPIPEWVDPMAFSIFDCYGYSYCANYNVPVNDAVPVFEFRTQTIANPYKESEEDPETVTQRIATQTR
jgi:hypothetical protein